MASFHQQDMPRLTFLQLPAEIRTKIYFHILPVATVLSVKPSTFENTTTPTDLEPLLRVAESPPHHDPASSSPLPVIPIEYYPPTYRFHNLSRLVTNATRPPFRELALTCRTLYHELSPQIAGTLSINVDSLPAAYATAIKLSNLALWVGELHVGRPFMAGMNSDDPRDAGNAKDDSVVEQWIEQTISWIRVVAGLMPRIRKLTFGAVSRPWVSTATISGCVNEEGREDLDEDGRWAWDAGQLRIMRGVAKAWAGKGQALVPASARQAAGMRQMLVVWEVRSVGQEDDLMDTYGLVNDRSLEEDWTLHEQWVKEVQERLAEGQGMAASAE